MEIIFATKAFRELKKLDVIIQSRILDKLAFFIAQKDPLWFAERLAGSRFGDWRF